MRKYLAAPLALCLLLASVGAAAADTVPPPQSGLDITVTSASVQARTGLVTFKGEITCEVDLDNLGMFVDVSQTVGRLFTVRGFGGVEGLSCAAGETVAFSAPVETFEGRFTPGRATYFVEAQGQGGCVEDPETGDVTCETEGFDFKGPLTIRLGGGR